MGKRGLILAIFVVLTLCIGVSATTGMSGVVYRSPQQVLNMYDQLQVDQPAFVTYGVKPDWNQKTTAGQLNPSVEQNALNTLNFVRYLAGLPCDVTLNNQYTQLAQNASFVNGTLDQLTHYPTCPAGMPQAIYEKGADGAAHSNISSGYKNLSTNIISGWMGEHTSQSNLTCVGHRRWILNPTMSETGFGFVNTPDGGSYSAMYAFDRAGDSTAKGVIWPAQTMPVEYFDDSYPWSYNFGEVLQKNLDITLTRQGDGRVWQMHTADGFKSGSYAVVDNNYYCQPGCVIFRPTDITYRAGDVYHVKMTCQGALFAEYTVSFMSLEHPAEVSRKSATITGASSWAKAELEDALKKDLPVDLFPTRYTANMTRGEFAQMLGEFLSAEHNLTGDTANTKFTDLVGGNLDMNRYIVLLSNLGIVKGTGDTTFSPKELLTREAAATMIYRAEAIFGSPEIHHTLAAFSDCNAISTWAVDGLTYLNQTGALKGTDGNRIDPQGHLTVEQAALLCCRLYK